MQLPLVKANDPVLSQLETQWKAILDPLIANPANATSLLANIILVNGKNVINHKLGKKLQGWIVVGNNASTTFYDSQSSNQQQQLTLILNASGACTINLLVF